MDTMHVESLWRFPVKSMLGESKDALEVTRFGVAGDRRYAIRDASGRVGSGKRTKAFNKIEGLFDFRAWYDGERASLSLRDGTTVAVDDPNIDGIMSEHLGQPVSLERDDGAGHLDDSPIHLLTTASLVWLKAALPDAQIDERRFRPNIVLAANGSEPVEQDWIGRTIEIGQSIVLRVTAPTERCGMIAHGQEDLQRDPRVLRYVKNQSDFMFGVYAAVVHPGTARVGDEVKVMGPEA